MSFRPFLPFRAFGGGAVQSFDPDAADYFARIVSAGSTISEANKTAVNAFVVGCKADGIWTAIKASCILAGADTLAGALVPLVGVAPTNVGGLFVAGDYSRTTGLKGNGTTKYLNSNAQHDISPQNNVHGSVYVTEGRQFGTNFYLGVVSGSTTHIGGDNLNPSGTYMVHFTNVSPARHAEVSFGFLGVSRNATNSFTRRLGAASTVVTQTASLTAPGTGTYGVFARGSTLLCSGRIAFYSIGESLNLELLDARVTTLMAALT